MPRLVRRQPLWERIKAALDPYDFLLWASEELHDSTFDEALKDYGLFIGLGLNVLYIIARSNAGSSTSQSNDVFGDYDGRGTPGWFTWLAAFTSHILASVAILNAVYTFFRRRHYRLFESNIDAMPSTPSARRVHVNSSPATGSPLRYLGSLLPSTDARSRAHADQQRDVWEISVWDPKAFNLELLTLFSPGHVLIYWLSLPVNPSDPRPSVTIVTSMFLAALFSVQLVALRHSFVQQAKDQKLVNKEVMNEYETKFVHASLHKPVRDVGTQSNETSGRAGTKTREVDVYTPTTIINRGFQVNPNPSYALHLSDESDDKLETPSQHRMSRSTTTPNLISPMRGNLHGQITDQRRYQAPVRLTPDLASPSRPPTFVNRQTSPTRGDGGSLGVYTHAASPLKKSASSSLLRPGERREIDASAGRKGSPLKRLSAPGDEGPKANSRASFGGAVARHRSINFS